MSEEKLNCWIDCDPGSDDAFAIIMALYSDKLNLLGISSVAGNQTLDKTTLNVLNTLNILGLIRSDQKENGGLGFPVLIGAEKPIMRELVTAEDVFGETGLGTHTSQQLPDVPQHTLDFVHESNARNGECHFTTRMYKLFKSSERKVNLIAIGPLTNIALLLLNHPDVTEYIEKLVIMGGSYSFGNVGPLSEFNIHVDPEAASIVFGSFRRLKIYMVPLDVTEKSSATVGHLERIERLGTRFSHILVDLLNFYKHKINRDPPLHDPCAVAFLIDPTLFEYKLVRVEVALGTKWSDGQTVCDFRNKFKLSEEQKNVHVCTNMNAEGFWTLMVDAIERANKITHLK